MEVVYKKAESNEEIRNWVVLHGGKPAIIDDPEVRLDAVGLRIDWPGKKDEGMLSAGREVTKDISWDEFFRIMDNEDLAFQYSEEEDINLTWRYRFIKKDAFEPAEES
jgi:hypothetical protein